MGRPTVSIRGLGGFVVACLVVVGALAYAAGRVASDDQTPLIASTQPGVGGPAAAAQPTPRRGARVAQVPVVDAAWVADVAVRAGIPAPAVRAYATAQLAAPQGCDIGWTTLAGIGWVESRHGTIGGRTLGDDGRSDTPVLGPALDGRGVAAIPSTAETSVWHGDPLWDHAVGPLQFIPSTWERWGADGDGDGVSDPNDIDDAASAALAYLCADGHDLTTGVGWADAVFGYNHDQAYVDSVHAAASAYAARTR